MIKTVIFDWAGTTWTFGCMALSTLLEMLSRKGIQLTDQEIRHEPMGKLK
ncbi:phosphonoacetaldehyde hydrolase [Enterococcus faecalis]|nr:phosphonoacetaldehyde hydrolase [Enterococcus faecalis]